jgi:hypothetical protein
MLTSRANRQQQPHPNSMGLMEVEVNAESRAAAVSEVLRGRGPGCGADLIRGGGGAPPGHRATVGSGGVSLHEKRFELSKSDGTLPAVRTAPVQPVSGGLRVPRLSQR